MSSPSPDDGLLVILLRNLHNAASTFGQDSRPYKDVLSTVNEHLQDMKRKGATTNIAKARELLRDSEQSQSQADAVVKTAEGSNVFGALAFRPKPKS